MTAHTQVRTLPGHKVVNLVLALAIWSVGVYFTARAFPIGGEFGSAAPIVIAIGIQLLLSAAQSNLRAFGVTMGRWPFVVMTGVDVAINMSGLLISRVEGVNTLSDTGLYLVLALSTGAGLWQCALAFFVAALIAAAPEQMVRDALRG